MYELTIIGGGPAGVAAGVYASRKQLRTLFITKEWGGNAAFETAAQLLAYAKSVTLLQRGDAYKADPVTVEHVLSHPNMTGVLNAQVTEVTGDKFVSGLTYLDAATNTPVTLAVSGIFIEIGMLPNTSYLGDIVEIDNYKRVVIDPWTQ